MHTGPGRRYRHRLDQLMSERDVSANQLARYLAGRGLKVNQTTISRIRSGDTDIAKAEEGTLRALAMFFGGGVTAAELRGPPTPLTHVKPGKGNAGVITGKYAALPSDDAIELARAWDSLPTERRLAYRTLILSDARQHERSGNVVSLPVDRARSKRRD